VSSFEGLLLLLLLLDLDEFDQRREQPMEDIWFLSFLVGGGRDVYRGKTTACTS
jgi:hypothetical protein